jgi:hypothetical protein
VLAPEPGSNLTAARGFSGGRQTECYYNGPRIYTDTRIHRSSDC